MKKWLIKLIGIYQPEPIDEQKMKDWLFNSFKTEGFKHYYTFRKRTLVNLLILENNPMKRAELQGRLNELGGLSANISTEAKSRKS